MSEDDTRSGASLPSLSRPVTRWFLVGFFLVTALLAFATARAIVADLRDPALQEKVATYRERKARNSLFTPADTTRRTSADSTNAR
jgi:hypothetical protein